MAGRGRGRGRGRGLSFDVGMIGFGRGEALPAAIQQPPPLYPVSESLYTYLSWFENALIISNFLKSRWNFHRYVVAAKFRKVI